MSLQFAAGLLIGAAAGAAIIHFLKTEEGKVFSAKLKRSALEVEDELAGMAEGLISKGKSFMDDLEGKVNKATS